MPPGDPQCLSCQGYIFSLLVMAKGIQAALEVMLVPCPRQKWWACGRISTSGNDRKTWSLLTFATTTQRMIIPILQIEKPSLWASMCPEPVTQPSLEPGRGMLWGGSHCSQLLPQRLQEVDQPFPRQAGQQQVRGQVRTWVWAPRGQQV